MARTKNADVEGTSLSSPPLEGDYEGSSPREEEASSFGEEENLSDNVESISEAEEERRSSYDSMGEQSIQGGEVESDNESDEEDQQPEQPASFYYGPENYKKSCKIGTRCSIYRVLKKLENTLGEMEMEWFTEQNQFKHMFHMPRERNRKCMGMWMLALRTACLEKRNSWWFVVNGVPVRYSIWEHGLISGLNCREYPQDYESLGSFRFVEKHFQRTNKIYLHEVEKELSSMEACEDRLKMGVLYFLASIMKAKSKVPSLVDEFLLRIVDDLQVCKRFPWGRYTFEVCSNELKHMLDHFKGEVKEKAMWTFPGFIIPLELLAFEAIPCLRMKYRINVASSRNCPRMCKSKFTHSGMKGYPLTEINETLGDTKDICSILEATLYEQQFLMRHIWVGDFARDFPDTIAEGMMAHLDDRKKIFWQDLYDRDIAARAEDNVSDEQAEEKGKKRQHATEQDETAPPPPAMWLELKEQMENGFKQTIVIMEVIEEKVDMIDARLKVVEEFQQILQKNYKGKEKVVDADEDAHMDDDHMDDDQFSGGRYANWDAYFDSGEGASGGRCSPVHQDEEDQPPEPGQPDQPQSPQAPHPTQLDQPPEPGQPDQPQSPHPTQSDQPQSPHPTQSDQPPQPDLDLLPLPMSKRPVSGPKPFGSTEPLKPISSHYKMCAKKRCDKVEKRTLRPSKYHKSPYTEGKNKNKEEKKEKEKEKKNKGKKKVKKNKKQKLV